MYSPRTRTLSEGEYERVKLWIEEETRRWLKRFPPPLPLINPDGWNRRAFVARGFVHYPWTDAICLVSRSRRLRIRSFSCQTVMNSSNCFIWPTRYIFCVFVTASWFILIIVSSCPYLVVSVSFIILLKSRKVKLIIIDLCYLNWRCSRKFKSQSTNTFNLCKYLVDECEKLGQKFLLL